ncbi:class I SAM-dependent methyltransferase [Aureitalea marina]|uniref:SAM-dependent methyltransferase n=1 Tax=Aureitalea marina TaxID=930804 RepID=A0A2S7KNR4_9FLAO|nr:class I SAM-dependent methyltransferase [Aureitalea marina]PQB04269.1 SAM-dependent methyltransferase [Aureitalea marina]
MLVEIPMGNHWYSFWFNTPYYHVLYKDRNDQEAAHFMNRLLEFLQLKPGSSILDLACGKGRHSIYLNSLGYDVTGLDLSERSIHAAKEFERSGLRFFVHDMTKPFPEQFDAVFNLFTSFGYFETEGEDLQTIQSIKSEMKPNGVGIIDFMNAEYVKNHLVPEETKVIDGIRFQISKRLEGEYIVKDIHLEDEHRSLRFTERVKTLYLSDFLRYFDQTGLNLIETFGDYELQPFDSERSDRLIMIFKTS